MRVAVMLHLFLCASLEAAPAPMPRPAKPPELGLWAKGRCLMTWRGVAAETTFHPDGFYSCFWAGKWWNGGWRCKDGVLSVTEWPLDNPDSRSSWSVKLSSAVEGVLLDHGSAWKTRPIVGGRID